jgi:hypothetical protein
VGAERSVDDADADAGIADVTSGGGSGEDMLHGCREGADCMAQHVGRVRL